MTSNETSTNKSKLSLYDLLVEAELTNYYTIFKSKLKLQHSDHLRYVTEADLQEIGMSKPEQRRLWKVFHKHFPPTIVGKLKKKVLQKVQSNENKSKGAKKLNRTASVQSPSNDQHIIPAQSIVLCKQLGSGEFGSVWQAVWTPPNRDEKLQVAVKCVSSEKMQANPLDFLQEAAIMHKVTHAHIVRLFGVVLDMKSVMLVSELAPLRSLLECLRDPALRPSFTALRLCDYAEAICDGMSYLESHRLIHRDLAARNILVFSAEKVKISDFGLSRSLGVGEEYYRSNFSVNLKLPIAWCAPECVNFLKFTSASDVWAFAVTLWEMFTYGFQPWAGMTGQQILDSIDCPKSQRLEVPDACSQEYYSMMLQCWEHDPNNRPKFEDLRSVLPEIRPDRVQSIICCNDGQPDHLQYETGKLITVLNKRPREYPDGYYWKGILESGRTGLFLPSNTVAHIDAEYPKLPANFSLSSTTSLTDIRVGGGLRSSFGKSNKGSSSKINREMISCPQGDLRHTGHVGIDGTCFGDIGFIDKRKLPRQVVAPMQQQSQSENNSPMPRTRFVSQQRLPSTTSENARLIPKSPSPANDYGSEHELNTSLPDLDTPEFENPFAGSNSLLDEVFEALGHPDRDMGNLTNIMEESTNSTLKEEPSSPPVSSMHPIDTTERTRLISTTAGSYKTDTKQSKPEAMVHPISRSDARMLDDLTMAAQKVSDKVLTKERQLTEEQLWQMGLAERPEHLNVSDDRNKRSPSAIKEKFAKTLKIHRTNSGDSTGNSPHDSPNNMTKSFSDCLPKSTGICQQWTPEAEDAYKLLIECGRSVTAAGDQPPPKDSPKRVPRRTKQETKVVENVEQPVQQEEEEEYNPLRHLRNDASGIARSFRPGSGRGRPVFPGIQRPTPAPRVINKRNSINTMHTDPMKSPPPPVPPKPMLPVSIRSHLLTQNMSESAHKSSPSPTESGSKMPEMTLESVDKYQLLDFVLSALDEKSPKQETEQSSNGLQYADLMLSQNSPKTSSLSSVGLRRESDDIVNV